MKKVVLIISMVICLFAASNSYAATVNEELEKVYKEQMTALNKDIVETHELMNISMKYGQLDKYYARRASRDEMIKQRNDLKIRVLERLNKLPEWWKEPEKDLYDPRTGENADKKR